MKTGRGVQAPRPVVQGPFKKLHEAMPTGQDERGPGLKPGNLGVQGRAVAWGGQDEEGPARKEPSRVDQCLVKEARTLNGKRQGPTAPALARQGS